MKYKLSVYSDTYPVEDVRMPSDSILNHQPAGHPYSFVSPIRLPIGKVCQLESDAGSYELMVNGCFGFAYCGKFFISGTIEARQSDGDLETASAVPEFARQPLWGPAR